jgi:N-methylhydantoinase B
MIDPILQSRVWSRVQAGLDETEAVFRSHALSPSLAEGETAICLFFPDGRVWAEGTESAPYLSALLSTWVSFLGSRLPTDPQGVWVSNDPYDGGGSLSDLKMVRAIPMGSSGVGWVAVGGVCADIGGRTAGGLAPEAESVQEEGFRIPLSAASDSLYRLAAANSRYPESFAADIAAQEQAVLSACEWIESLADGFSWDVVVSASQSVSERSRKALALAKAELSEGSYIRRDRLDDDGGANSFRSLVVTAGVTDDLMILDFEGSAEQSVGPTHCTRESVLAACGVAIRQVFPEIPACAFPIGNLEIRVPSGSLLDAHYPTPVGGTTAVLAERIASVVLEALSQSVHGRGRACDGGGGNVLVLEGQDRGRPFSVRLIVGSGGGASGRGDGLDNSEPATRYSIFPSVEALERRYPVRIRQYTERDESGGAGRYRGGAGTIFELESLVSDARLTVYADRSQRGAGGHHRGGRGATARVEVSLGGQWRSLSEAGQRQNIKLAAGDRVRLHTAGGGGYGHPYERAIRLISDDVVSGRLTRKSAAKEHGVVYTSSDARDYDSAKTFKLRSYRLTSSDVDDYLDEIETLED